MTGNCTKGGVLGDGLTNFCLYWGRVDINRERSKGWKVGVIHRGERVQYFFKSCRMIEDQRMK